MAIAASSTRPDRRTELVVAAAQIIAVSGFEGLRLRSVAVEVGIDHSTLHHHFATKADLITALSEHCARRFWATMPVEGSAAERLLAHLSALAELMATDPELFAVLAELDLRARRDPAVRHTLERQEAGWRQVLGEVLREMADEGTVPVLTELVIATVKGIRLRPEHARPVLTCLARALAERAQGPDP